MKSSSEIVEIRSELTQGEVLGLELGLRLRLENNLGGEDVKSIAER